ncbi:PREDICTED: spore germination protein 270-11-like [Cyprinodon variegatus]|uniref:spore germination protein 270-11-like n=1 Tax=Cyprinodon variegatus TaxID=28743 RepID=UPI00074289BD|nr:PREDICTED: spore germination protein 270-11-like [Cyprinodon variegatus]
MSSSCLIFIGLVLTSVAAMKTTPGIDISTVNDTITGYSDITTETPLPTTNSIGNISEIQTTSESMTESAKNRSNIPTQPENSNGTNKSNSESISPTTTVFIAPSTTPAPYAEKTETSTKTNPPTTPKSKGSSAGSNAGIILLVVILILLLGVAFACFVARRRGRVYSMNVPPQPDENIPLSTVEPELIVEAAPQNGLKTFESTETQAAKEPQEPEVATETHAEKKEEAAPSAAAPSSEPAAPPEAPAAAVPDNTPEAPPPDSSEEKPKVDDAKQSPPAPVDPSADEKTDDEGVASNKTSVESLKETNENNSNSRNFSFSQRRGIYS